MTAIYRMRVNSRDFNILCFRYESKSRFPKKHGLSVRETWQAQQVWYHPLEFDENLGFANFPALHGSRPLCDAKARDIMQPLIGEYVDFLPLASPTISDSEYWLIHPIKVLDCLDYKRTEYKYYGRTKFVLQHAFKESCVEGIPIFVLPIQNSHKIFVNDDFKNMVDKHGLTGLEIKPVWQASAEADQPSIVKDIEASIGRAMSSVRTRISRQEAVSDDCPEPEDKL